MDKQVASSAGAPRLKKGLSMISVWALSFGCSVGWGSFVLSGNTFLPHAGPLGIVIGMLIGALIMLIIGVNYSYLIKRYPDAGGTYTYSKEMFGHDHGYLSAWFLGLVYLAIIWANATAIPLIFRGIFGDALKFGYCYTIAGYEVYVGEILVSLAALIIFGAVCLFGGRTTGIVQTVLAVILIAGILFGFGAAFFRSGGAAFSNLSPSFSPEFNPGVCIVFIVFLAPWAFAGFESVSNSAEEFRFSPKKILRVIVVALVSAAAAYILLSLIAASSQPEGYSGWLDYTKDLDNEALGRYAGIPTLFGLNTALGNVGVALFGVAAAAGIITGLIGNLTAGSRLVFSMARDDLIPSRLGALNRFGAPKYAILFLIIISLPIPFFGRSAIGWIIDVNTIGITVAYAYTSAAAFKAAWKEKKKSVLATGVLGIVFSVFFLFYFLIPNLIPKLSHITSLSVESYLMLMAWAVLGFVLFFSLFRRDRAGRMGKSILIWIVLLALIFFTALIWIDGVNGKTVENAIAILGAEYSDHTASEESFISSLSGYFGGVSGTVTRNTIVLFALVIVSILIIFYTYSTVRKRHAAAEEKKVVAEQSSQAKSSFLSNMSHDIRTPMNAIIGYVTLARKEKDLTPKTDEYLAKIQDSSGHLLSLINDVLEMSRIESGRMEIMPVPTDLRATMIEAYDLFSTQMKAKGIKYEVLCEDDEVEDVNVLCDKNRLDRVLLNLISNAYKFTPEGGSVTVRVTETGREEDTATYRISVKDTGIGMSPEFAAKVFEAYERERTLTVENIQGTGLGTAITKNIVELMGGSIEVFSEQGKGSEFVVTVPLKVDLNAVRISSLSEAEKAAAAAFAGMHVLLVEDDPANRDVERTMFEEAGFIVDTAVNGEDAVEMVAASKPGDYAVVLMDIEMPVKNGYNATKLIRSLKNPELAKIPIVALTAKAFSEDVAAAFEAGMNGHIAKPINMTTVADTLSEIFAKE